MYNVERLVNGNWQRQSVHFNLKLAQDAYFIACGAEPEFKLFNMVWDSDEGKMKIVETHQSQGRLNSDIRIHEVR